MVIRSVWQFWFQWRPLIFFNWRETWANSPAGSAAFGQFGPFQLFSNWSSKARAEKVKNNFGQCFAQISNLRQPEVQFTDKASAGESGKDPGASQSASSRAGRVQPAQRECCLSRGRIYWHFSWKLNLINLQISRQSRFIWSFFREMSLISWPRINMKHLFGDDWLSKMLADSMNHSSILITVLIWLNVS